MKVAIVHEWLDTFAGSERVVEQLCSRAGRRPTSSWSATSCPSPRAASSAGGGRARPSFSACLSREPGSAGTWA